MNSFQSKFDPLVWAVVDNIPPGQVMSYGEVARAAGYPRYSRMVSAAMGRSPKPLPWFRVLRSDRSLAFEFGSPAYREQSRLLSQEGIRFDGKKVIATSADKSLDQILWGPEDS